MRHQLLLASASILTLSLASITPVLATMPLNTNNSVAVDPYNDGFKNAPAGRAQLPTLLKAYAARAPWKVAGVDYAVGIPASRALKDPTIASHLPAGASVDAVNRMIRVSGNNVTLDSYDFSLHGGYTVYITGANATISNSNFAIGSNNAYYEVLDQSKAGGLTLVNNTMDESKAVHASGFIGYSSPGAVILEYNWFKNFPQHVLEMVTTKGENFSLLYKYNLIDEGGLEYKAHLNFLQFNSGNATSVDVEFNTTYQTPQVASGEGFQLDSYGTTPAAIQQATISHNTMIATGGTRGSAMSYILHGGKADVAAGTISNNYFVTTAAYGAFYPETFSGMSIANNIDMTKNGKVVNDDDTETTQKLTTPVMPVITPPKVITLPMQPVQ